MNRVNYLFLPVLIIAFQHGFSQPGFNLIKETIYPQSHLYDLIVKDDTIIGYGVAFSDSVQPKQGLVLAKFDSSGNFITSNLILDSLNDVLALDKHWGKITKTGDGGYSMTAATFFRNSAMLIKVNNELEVEFIKEYEDTVNLSNYNYRILEIQDGYLLYGSIQRPNFLDDAFIRRVDKQGNTIWFKYFGKYSVSDNIIDIKPINDSTFIACSVDGMTSDVFGSSQSKLRYIDWHGNVLDSFVTEPDPEIGYLRRVMVEESGDIVTYGLYLVEVIGTAKIVQPTIARFTPDFQLQWVKHYGRIKSLASQVVFRDIELTLDGNYIGAGESAIDSPVGSAFASGWLMKFSPEGDSLWSRYDLAPFPPDNGNNHFFGGVGLLSSGNIIAGGTAVEDNKHYIWLVKVTPDGCLDTLFCQPVTTLDVAVAETAINIYPNPADKILTIEAKNGFQAGDALLFDLQGKIVLKQPLPNTAGQLTLSTAHLAPGIYFMTIQTSSGTLQRFKIFIAH